MIRQGCSGYGVRGCRMGVAMSRSIRIRALALLVAGAAAVSPCRAASQGRNATIALSTGETIVGKVWITRGRMLLLRLPKVASPKQFSLSQLARIDVTILKNRIEKEWRFKEEGSPIKVFTGRTRPRIDCGLKLTLTDGKVLEGTIVKGTPLHVETPDGKRRRQWLAYNISGELGQSLKDIVYVKSVVFEPPADAGTKTDAAPKAPPEKDR